MRVGVFTALFSKLSFEEVIARIKPLGITTVELGTGNYPGDPHIKLEWLKDGTRLKEFKQKLEDEGISISALSSHGNSLHPNKQIGASPRRDQPKDDSARGKAGRQDGDRFLRLSGRFRHAKYPNWSPTPWPPDYLDLLKWQWERRSIPYWKKHAKFAEDHGVRIAIEMHPGVPGLQSRKHAAAAREAGKAVGCNFDPSHMFWQGIDPCAAIRVLGEAVFHCPRQGHANL